MELKLIFYKILTSIKVLSLPFDVFVLITSLKKTQKNTEASKVNRKYVVKLVMFHFLGGKLLRMLDS